MAGHDRQARHRPAAPLGAARRRRRAPPGATGWTYGWATSVAKAPRLQEADMRYQLTPIFTRPWLLNGLSLRLIESHYENHYGGALRRLNAITEQLEALDLATAPPYVVTSLK